MTNHLDEALTSRTMRLLADIESLQDMECSSLIQSTKDALSTYEAVVRGYNATTLAHTSHETAVVKLGWLKAHRTNVEAHLSAVEQRECGTQAVREKLRESFSSHERTYGKVVNVLRKIQPPKTSTTGKRSYVRKARTLTDDHKHKLQEGTREYWAAVRRERETA